MTPLKVLLPHLEDFEYLFARVIIIDFAQNLCAKLSVDPSPQPLRAPEILDLEKVQSWLSGSVLALLSLNALALLMFLLSLFSPQLVRLVQNLKTLFQSSPTVPKEPPAQFEMTAAPAVQETLDLPKIQETVEKSPAAPVTSPTPEPTPAVQQAVEEVVEVPKVEESVEEVVEVPKVEESVEETVDIPKTDTYETQQTEIMTPPGSSPEVTQIMTKEEQKSVLPPSPPLPEKTESSHKETKMPPPADSSTSIEATLDEALVGIDTKEMSIFDPSAIDEVLKEDGKS